MSWTSRLASHLDSAESAIDTPTKLDTLRRFYQTILGIQEEEREGASSPLAELLPRLFELQSDESPPVRKIVSEIIGEIGLKRVELVPEIVPVLMSVVEDPTPAVAKQAIKCGICLFRHTLRKIALQGRYTSELGEMLKSSWVSVQEFKEKIHSLAFQAGSGGVRLLALRSLEAVILLYTPDPNGTHEPPVPEGDSLEFNISWVRGGHPVLNAGDLSIEASKMLNLLLDQLRVPTIKSLSNLVIIVLTKSLATIAKKRPPYYGRILPVLLGVDPSNSVLKGIHAYGARLALKNAFLSCLNCTHPGAAPWRERLAGALRGVKLGGMEEEIVHQTSNPDENKEKHETKGNFLDVKEEKPSIMPRDDATSIPGRKRSGPEDDVTSAEDNDLPGKRARSMSTDSEGPLKDPRESAMDIKEEAAGSADKRGTDDSGPVQQLVAMFGALVAQGEKAVGSLEILISSISADLLAEVVIANMRHLPSSQPYAEGDDVSLVNMTMKGSDSEAKYPPSFLAGVLSLSTSYPQVVSRLHVNRSIPDNTTIEEERLDLPDLAFDDNSNHHIDEVGPEIPPPSVPLSSNDSISKMEEEILPIMSGIHEVDNLDGEIPGLDSSARSDRISENTRTSSLISAEFEDANREQFVSVSSRLSLELHPSTSTERSEELSPKGAATDASSIVSSTATSTGLPTIVVLPKLSAPVVNLDDVQTDQLQSLAFVRIIEAYKHTAVAGSSQVRFSLLANLGVEFPSDIDPWKPLQNHILSDYVNLEGHELTLRVLYRLFSEVEEDRDFFSSTTAATAYEMFILTVAETLRESFPPSDKSLSKLLGEAPYLPKSILNLLESLCCPGNSDKTEESHSGDRVTQGLSTVWSLILHRPPLRDSCLKIALQSAVHHLEEVRMKAIRLVANKLFPVPTISQQIEDFAKEMLISVMQVDVADGTDADGSNTESQKDPVLEKQSNENQSVSAVSRDVSSDTHQSCTSKSISSLSTSEAQRCMSLYFALCTKKHSLFRHVFLVYKSTSKAVKQAVRLHIPILVRTIGSSSGLLEIISDPPLGSEELLLQVLQTLTDRIVPSPELLATIKKLYDTKLKDAEILIPILPFLPRDEVLVVFPHLVNLPPEKFQAALAHILQGSSHSGAVLTPSEVLIAIHGIDPDRDAIPLKKITDACNACFEQPQIFTQQVIAKVLNQLVEQIPLPLLFMRTVLQAIGAYPALVDFVLEILSRLVSKQIWKYPKLWVGFLRCAFLTKPQSFSVLLQLPPPQLENALNRTPALKAPLVAHASQPNIKSSLPRSVLVVLGIVTDAPTASLAQTVDTSNSDKEAQTEMPKESSNAT